MHDVMLFSIYAKLISGGDLFNLMLIISLYLFGIIVLAFYIFYY